MSLAAEMVPPWQLREIIADLEAGNTRLRATNARLVEQMAELFRTIYATENDRRYAATTALDSTLEEAAKQCEGDFDTEMTSYGEYFAAAIRALKVAP